MDFLDLHWFDDPSDSSIDLIAVEAGGEGSLLECMHDADQVSPGQVTRVCMVYFKLFTFDDIYLENELSIVVRGDEACRVTREIDAAHERARKFEEAAGTIRTRHENLEAALEKKLDEPLDPNYRRVLSEARDRVQDSASLSSSSS